MSPIHSTAILDPATKLGENVQIGPYCVVGPEVELGDGVRLPGPRPVADQYAAPVNLDTLDFLGVFCHHRDDCRVLLKKSNGASCLWFRDKQPPCRRALLVQRITVHPNKRRQGLATAFLTSLTQQGRCVQLEQCITPDSQHLAAALVQHHGWQWLDEYNVAWCPQAAQAAAAAKAAQAAAAAPSQ